MSANTGQKTVAVPGTAEALGSGSVNGPLLVKALETNTGVVVVGNDGGNDVDMSSGFHLSAAESIEFRWVGDLGRIRVDAAIAGEGVCWALLAV